MTIGKRISTLRRERNLTQEYLAFKLHVSRQAVSKWENDLSAPDTNNLIALAGLFQVSVEYLATGKEDCAAVPRKDGKDVPAILGTIAVFLLFMIIPINLIGYISGAFPDMMSIPIGSGIRMGIWLGYGQSPFAVILLFLEAAAILAAGILLITSCSMMRRKQT